jgi:hypothetical protein
MDERFDVIDCNARCAWRMPDEATAVRYAAARHAATGNVVELVRTTAEGAEQKLVLPPSAPLARP